MSEINKICPICNQTFDTKEILIHLVNVHKSIITKMLVDDISEFGEIKLSLDGSVTEFLNQLDVRVKEQRKRDKEEKEYKEIDFNERAPISQIIPTIFIDKWFLNSDLGFDYSDIFLKFNWLRNGIVHNLKNSQGNAIIANQDNCQQVFNFIHNKLSNKVLEI